LPVHPDNRSKLLSRVGLCEIFSSEGLNFSQVILLFLRVDSFKINVLIASYKMIT
jgi:hypothetical protein